MTFTVGILNGTLHSLRIEGTHREFFLHLTAKIPEFASFGLVKVIVIGYFCKVLDHFQKY